MKQISRVKEKGTDEIDYRFTPQSTQESQGKKQLNPMMRGEREIKTPKNFPTPPSQQIFPYPDRFFLLADQN